MKTCLVIFGIIAISVSIWIIYQNSASEKIASKGLAMLILGSTGFLVTFLLSLKNEVKSVEFPVVFFYHKDTLYPLEVIELVLSQSGFLTSHVVKIEPLFF